MPSLPRECPSNSPQGHVDEWSDPSQPDQTKSKRWRFRNIRSTKCGAFVSRDITNARCAVCQNEMHYNSRHQTQTRIYMYPLERIETKLGMYSCKKHSHVISFTADKPLIGNWKPSSVMNAQWWTKFSTNVTNMEDASFAPKQINETVQRWAKDETIKCLKVTCPKNDTSQAFFAHAIERFRTVDIWDNPRNHVLLTEQRHCGHLKLIFTRYSLANGEVMRIPCHSYIFHVRLKGVQLRLPSTSFSWKFNLLTSA